MDAESEQVTAYRAEIERLKQGKNILSDLLYKMEAKANNHEKLITELCDALEESLPMMRYAPEFKLPFYPLIQRAREATR